jgi:two-component system chemotaxis sensor kinase CheA
MESALKKGLEIPQNISEQELFLLLFNDGFSLKDCVTKISGRGVGLSAIKAEVEALGGVVSISSTLGKGSKFNFKLPYT